MSAVAARGAAGYLAASGRGEISLERMQQAMDQIAAGGRRLEAERAARELMREREAKSTAAKAAQRR